uniref:Uncharacterized protein n=1 Tax=Romanomermis culicivorax TaxID=13658 RepID=A0A915KY59_ROMCU
MAVLQRRTSSSISGDKEEERILIRGRRPWHQDMGQLGWALNPDLLMESTRVLTRQPVRHQGVSEFRRHAAMG